MYRKKTGEDETEEHLHIFFNSWVKQERSSISTAKTTIKTPSISWWACVGPIQHISFPGWPELTLLGWELHSHASHPKDGLCLHHPEHSPGAGLLGRSLKEFKQMHHLLVGSFLTTVPALPPPPLHYTSHWELFYYWTMHHTPVSSS